ncbi:MAG: STAS/SEC14 domain-containing protein [Phenylobacterium sp.]
MFAFYDDLPADVLGLVASGPITHEDYQRLIPRVEAMLGKGPVKALYVLEDDASEFSPHAFWDDQVFSLKHWNDFSHLALVTDQAWMRAAARLFAPFFPGRMKLFSKAQLAEAKAWIVEPT